MMHTQASSAWSSSSSSTTLTAPLALFRVLWGGLLFISILRFAYRGWIERLYLEPRFFFSYLGFEWVKPLGAWTYGLFALCALCALLLMVGLWYRWASVGLFLSFTYIELMDKTTYLNHYYFVSVVCFVLIFLPAHRYFSLDVRRCPGLKAARAPRWTVDSLKLLLSIVYFCAGLAKLNSDWLLSALPLRIWLPAKAHLPVIGPLLTEPFTAYLLSWGGAAYDLCIPFLLWWSRSRPFALVAVVGFHLLTRVLFPIGMFPYIMIAASLIFCRPEWHQRIIDRLRAWWGQAAENTTAMATYHPAGWRRPLIVAVLVVQVLLPFRNWLYPGELFWTEQGFRFSWRVMLMEKAGYAQFKVVDEATGASLQVDNSEFLTPFQEKQMSFQPDFILEYAHFLAAHFTRNGWQSPAVYVESYVALNGRPSRPYIDPTVNLASIRPSLRHKDWILPYPYRDEIRGF